MNNYWEVSNIDLNSIISNEWFNDNIILSCLFVLSNSLETKSHILDGPVAKDILSDISVSVSKLSFLIRIFENNFDFIVSPINVNDNHWILFCASINDKIIYYIDPLKNNTEFIKANKKLLENWR